METIPPSPDNTNIYAYVNLKSILMGRSLRRIVLRIIACKARFLDEAQFGMNETCHAVALLAGGVWHLFQITIFETTSPWKLLQPLVDVYGSTNLNIDVTFLHVISHILEANSDDVLEVLRRSDPAALCCTGIPTQFST